MYQAAQTTRNKPTADSRNFSREERFLCIHFCVIPYFARRSLPLPDLENFLDVPASRLQELEDSIAADPEADEAADSDVSSVGAASLSDVPGSSDVEE